MYYNYCTSVVSKKSSVWIIIIFSYVVVGVVGGVENKADGRNEALITPFKSISKVIDDIRLNTFGNKGVSIRMTVE